MRKVCADCVGCGERVGRVPAVRGDAQARVLLHEQLRRVTGAAWVRCRVIRNMHSDYGYYGLTLYLRKEEGLFGAGRRKTSAGE